MLGVDETTQFAVTGVEDVQTVLTELTTLSARMMPPVSLDVAVVEEEEKQVIVAEVPECDYLYKPCCYIAWVWLALCLRYSRPKSDSF